MNQFLDTLQANDLDRLLLDWPLWARKGQRPPICEWRTWILLGGRGAGKTRTGAEWLKGVALADSHQPGNAGGYVALIGESYSAARDVMVEGESGLLRIHNKFERPTWLSSRRELVWPNGTIGRVFSSADPEGLRGHQFGASWSDEICKWRKGETTWDMLQFCLRLGSYPRQVVTTTPKPIALLRKLVKATDTVVCRSSTFENRANLAPGFLDYISKTYGGTSLGRQELDGEIVEDHEHALWRRDMIKARRVSEAPALGRIVVAVDPPASSGKRSASCGIVAVGKAVDGTCYVLADRTCKAVRPNEWASAAISLYRELDADLVVAETNQGGEMVKTVLQEVDATLPVRGVHASRGKWLRAEPVALLYERGVVRHVG